MMRLFALFFSMALISSPPAHSLERQQASIFLTNKTGKPISEVTVRHKYSDVYKDKAVWKGEIRNGQTVQLNDGEDPKKFAIIRYHTGFGTTGADWWLLTWKDADGKEYVSNPENFRKAVDALEKFLMGSTSVAKAALPFTGIAGIAGGLAVDVIADALLNSEATYDKELGVAFKQFILRTKSPVQFELGAYNGTQGMIGLGLRTAKGKFDQREDTVFRALTDKEIAAIETFQEKAIEEGIKRLEAERKKLADELARRKKERENTGK
jgi:hypothetical protein